MFVGGENFLSSAAGEECNRDNTSGRVRGVLPRKMYRVSFSSQNISYGESA